MDFKKDENYSKAGKTSLKKYLYLFTQKQKTKKFEDNFGFSEKTNQNDIDENELYFMQENIFNKTYNNKNIDEYKSKKLKKFDVKSVCSSLNKKRNTLSEFANVRNDIINNKFNERYDKFKYHLLHHNDKFDKTFLNGQKSPSCSQYQPKYEKKTQKT